MNEQKQTVRASRERETPHPSRAQDTWDNADIHEMESMAHTQARTLPDLPPRPGFTQRWIRVKAREGVDDAKNVTKKTREGWKPRPMSTVPAGFAMPTIQHGEWAGCLGVEGSVLMEMPESLAKIKRKANEDRTKLITSSLESELQSKSTSAMPITQTRKTTIGREVKVADD